VTPKRGKPRALKKRKKAEVGSRPTKQRKTGKKVKPPAKKKTKVKRKPAKPPKSRAGAPPLSDSLVLVGERLAGGLAAAEPPKKLGRLRAYVPRATTKKVKRPPRAVAGGKTAKKAAAAILAERFRPSPTNPRAITPEAMDGLRFSLSVFGDLSGFVVNATTDHIVCGHQRKAAAAGIDFAGLVWGKPYTAALGYPSSRFVSTERDAMVETGDGARFRVRLVKWPAAFETAANLAANNPAIHGDFTADLDGLLETVRREEPNAYDRLLFGGLGSTPSAILKTAPPALDDIPAKPVKPVSRVGDTWRLGNHRVLCGDATKRADVVSLFPKPAADLLLTDPPYGVIYSSAKKDAISGDLSQAVIPVSFAIAVEHVLNAAARLYVCGGIHNVGMYSSLFDHHLQQQPHFIIWMKDAFVMRHTNYHSQFEVIYFGWLGRGGSPEFWFGDRKCSDVWQFPRDRDRKHPTQKPAALFMRAIRNSCPPGGLVFDPFLGSGTALVAAEELGRVCYGMELDPHYVDVTVQRWAEQTGRKPTLAGTRKTFEQVMNQRR